MSSDKLAEMYTVLAGRMDRLAERIEALEQHVPQRIDAHDSELITLRMAVHNIDVRTTQMQAMLIQDHTRIDRIHANSNRIVELLERVYGRQAVTKENVTDE